jgi:acetylornithine deacetylase/succinyl-diaminopimelate desuccinylase-like protein
MEANRSRHLEELMAWLRFPSISAISDHKPDMERCAAWTMEEMRRVGLQSVRLLPTAGHPSVYGEWLGAPGKPTVLIYGHYDVQPVDPLPLWETPPFEPSVRDGLLYARGATDDKGQTFLHLKAIEGLLRTEGTLPVNVKVLIEGEEEIGSRNLAPMLREQKELLAADLAVISDTSLWAPGVPTVTYGLRGLTSLEVVVRGAKSDLHSGLYGGAAPNAATAAARLITSLHQADGRVAVPGFYDDVRALTPEERENFAALGFDEEELQRELAVAALPGEPGFTALERMWARPTLEINGMGGGFQGEGEKTVIPKEASFKITCRLVPHQDPIRIREQVKVHLQANCPPGVTLEYIVYRSGTPGVLVPIDHPAMKAAARSLEAVFGGETRFIRSGGSIPVVVMLQQVLGISSVLIGFGLETENLHAPNEHFHLENFDHGLQVLGRFYHEVAAAL